MCNMVSNECLLGSWYYSLTTNCLLGDYRHCGLSRMDHLWIPWNKCGSIWVQRFSSWCFKWLNCIISMKSKNPNWNDLGLFMFVTLLNHSVIEWRYNYGYILQLNKVKITRHSSISKPSSYALVQPLRLYTILINSYLATVLSIWLCYFLFLNQVDLSAMSNYQWTFWYSNRHPVNNSN